MGLDGHDWIWESRTGLRRARLDLGELLGLGRTTGFRESHQVWGEPLGLEGHGFQPCR